MAGQAWLIFPSADRLSARVDVPRLLGKLAFPASCRRLRLGVAGLAAPQHGQGRPGLWRWRPFVLSYRDRPASYRATAPIFLEPLGNVENTCRSPHAGQLDRRYEGRAAQLR